MCSQTLIPASSIGMQHTSPDVWRLSGQWPHDSMSSQRGGRLTCFLLLRRLLQVCI